MQSLINRYARIILDALVHGNDAFPKQLIVYMKRRGHLSVLKQAVAKAERLAAARPHAVVTVARAADAKKYAAAIASTLESLGGTKDDYTIRVDDNAVGGYAVRARNQLVDQTFRQALVSLYQHSIQ